MEAVFELEGPVVAVPQCGKKLLTSDDRAFDAEMVRGFLVLMNLCTVGPEPLGFGYTNWRLPRPEEATEIVNKAFGWVPEVIRRRAEAAGMPGPLRGLQWTEPTVEEVAACPAVFPLFRLPMNYRLVQEIHLDLDRCIITADKWFNKVMRALPIYSWYRYDERHGVQLTAVPLLTGVQQCVAYALAVVQLDRWKPSIGERVRMCPYRYPQFGDDQKGHLFLDYRFSKDGQLEKNRQKFCCHEHANRFKQRSHRERKARTGRQI